MGRRLVSSHRRVQSLPEQLLRLVCRMFVPLDALLEELREFLVALRILDVLLAGGRAFEAVVDDADQVERRIGGAGPALSHAGLHALGLAALHGLLPEVATCATGHLL